MTLDDIANGVIEHIGRAKLYYFGWKVGYGEVSNSHCAPRKGVTNWRGDKDKPTSYPGYSGRAWIAYKDNPIAFLASENFEGSLTYPGTGGAGFYCPSPFDDLIPKHHKGSGLPKRFYPCSWDYRFFLDDFPELKKEVDKRRVICALTGIDFADQHDFEWRANVKNLGGRVSS